MHMVGVFLGIT